MTEAQVIGEAKDRDWLEMPAATKDWDRAKADLERFGLAIVEDALTPRELKALRDRVVEQAAAERVAGVASLEHDGANQRIWNLINKGAIFAELLHKPLVRDAMSHILGGRFTISSYTANIAGRGGAEMMLHCRSGLRAARDSDSARREHHVDARRFHRCEWRNARGTRFASAASASGSAEPTAQRCRHRPRR